MDVEYTGRQTTITKKLKSQAEEGVEAIAKIVGNSGSVHVILSTDKYRQIAEVTVQTRHQKLVARCEATDMIVALHDALAKIEQQAIRHKKRFGTIKRHPKSDLKGAAAEVVAPVARKTAVGKVATKNSVGRKAVPMLVHSFPSHSPLAEPHVVRSNDSVALRPMSIEEAVKEAAFRDREVFVFRDHGGQAMVLYRKRDGKMELIEVP
ncbi:ribosome-associated translation inhibitor RaiA [Tunturiibacter empetritectus]|uniref:Ribosome hibernation promoting factor n=1 Tax=Tunturiibacter lichenicola TaxID=2051959 RepID=A0A852VK19_9BACT|nr:ribosome-associated translation inhibitor RaiA [Edaphobacter lichenicola]NYF90784.1 putative sigma-54 modulation protein [Edaphobacter lichenicola]